MGHSQQTTKYTEKLVLKKNNIFRVVYAQYKKTKMSVMQQEFNKEGFMIRNLTFNYCGGWLFNDPHDKCRWYNRNTEKYEEEFGKDRWWKVLTCGIYGTTNQSFDEIESIILKSSYKGFIYTLKAYRKHYETNYSISTIFLLLDLWNKDSRVEYLMKLGQLDLALKSAYLFRLTEKKQNELISIIKKHKDKKFVSYEEVKATGKGIENYNLYHDCKGNIDIYNYLLKQNEEIGLYRDYVSMAKDNGHDLTQDYWKYPSNLRERHNQMLDQKENIRFAKEKDTCDKILKIATKLAKKLNTKINGYDIVVASSIDDIREQAKVLSQCLITCSYYKKYADKECILVFIKKGNERLATAEISYNKEKPLGQFYADEKDRNNCLPNNDIKSALDSWLSNIYAKTNLRHLQYSK